MLYPEANIISTEETITACKPRGCCAAEEYS